MLIFMFTFKNFADQPQKHINLHSIVLPLPMPFITTYTKPCLSPDDEPVRTMGKFMPETRDFWGSTHHPRSGHSRIISFITNSGTIGSGKFEVNRLSAWPYFMKSSGSSNDVTIERNYMRICGWLGNNFNGKVCPVLWFLDFLKLFLQIERISTHFTTF